MVSVRSGWPHDGEEGEVLAKLPGNCYRVQFQEDLGIQVRSMVALEPLVLLDAPTRDNFAAVRADLDDLEEYALVAGEDWRSAVNVELGPVVEKIRRMTEAMKALQD